MIFAAFDILQCTQILGAWDRYRPIVHETQLSLTNRATRLEVSRGHQTWYHSML